MAFNNTCLEDLQELCQANDEITQFKSINTTSDEDENLKFANKLLKARTLSSRLLESYETNLNSSSKMKDKSVDELVANCNALLDYIEFETFNVHIFVRKIYATRFPELENIVPHPMDYARVVMQIGNETNLALVDFQGILPSSTIMVVVVAGSTTSGKPLQEHTLKIIMEACNCMIALDVIKNKVLEILERRMTSVAPNLTTIVGSCIAAKLIGFAGGVYELATMPACNLQLLGAKRNTDLEEYSTTTTINHLGIIFESEIVQRTPPLFRKKACRLVAAKSSLSIRIDYKRGKDTEGQSFLNEITKKIANWQKPQPPPMSIALPIPNDLVKKRRGGIRHRKRKEKFEHMFKSSKRVPFGISQSNSCSEEYS